MSRESDERRDALLGARRGTRRRLELRRRIGEAASGTVHRAADLEDGTPLAVRFLRHDPARDVKIAKRFIREGTRMRGVTHDPLVEVRGCGRQRGRLLLVSEFIRGSNLGEILEKHGRLSTTRTLRIRHDLAEGVAAMHERGILHRDLEPGTVLLGSPDARVKVTDFGIARFLGDSTPTMRNEYLGTPGYSSPEQMRGARVDSGTRARGG